MIVTTRRIRAAAALLACMSIPALMNAPAHAADAPKATITLKVAPSKLGNIIVDDKGMSIYMFSPDKRNVSVCEGQCLVAWPPLMLSKTGSLADVALSDGLRRSQLGVALREDGSRQVTYGGWPLYYWFRDAKAGDVNGQWVGNVWFVMNGEGTPVTLRVPA
jgi:predicted lipoprotein with Yx(FWY)xxD motif